MDAYIVNWKKSDVEEIESSQLKDKWEELIESGS